jgi:hypothetical protein
MGNQPIARWLVAAQQVVAPVLALALLIAVAGGQTGTQVIDRAVASRLLALHQHGVLGEAEHIHAHATPAPFVYDHCHADAYDLMPNTTGLADAQAAGALAGSSICAGGIEVPAAPAPGIASATAISSPVEGVAIAPTPRPPRA